MIRYEYTLHTKQKFSLIMLGNNKEAENNQEPALRFHFSAWKASTRLAAALDASIVGTVLGAATVSGAERLLTDYHPFLNHIAMTVLNEELARYQPQLVTPQTLLGLYRQVFTWSLIVGGVSGLIRGFRS